MSWFAVRANGTSSSRLPRPAFSFAAGARSSCRILQLGKHLPLTNVAALVHQQARHEPVVLARRPAICSPRAWRTPSRTADNRAADGNLTWTARPFLLRRRRSRGHPISGWPCRPARVRRSVPPRPPSGRSRRSVACNFPVWRGCPIVNASLSSFAWGVLRQTVRRGLHATWWSGARWSGLALVRQGHRNRMPACGDGGEAGMAVPVRLRFPSAARCQPLTASSTLEAEQMPTCWPRRGLVTRLAGDEGSNVVRGQVLAELEDADKKIALQQAKLKATRQTRSTSVPCVARRPAHQSAGVRPDPNHQRAGVCRGDSATLNLSYTKILARSAAVVVERAVVAGRHIKPGKNC